MVYSMLLAEEALEEVAENPASPTGRLLRRLF